MAELPPIVAIVGRKNSGKTTLLVAVAAELKRRGLRVASVKHGHHDFEIDHPGRDSWRHVHEGGVEAVLFLASGKLAMVMNLPGEEPSVEEMVERHFGGREYDLILVEGFKMSALPRIEVHRRGAVEGSLASAGAAPGPYLALVTDDPALRPTWPVIRLAGPDPAAPHVREVADLLSAFAASGGRGG
jgi:molybdopterin-guanine dinucleotide biosynthesis protein MobB